MIIKDLGAVTAYAYAVGKGYTGTEEEYAELMASYATVAEEAAESAESASTSATNASASASTATQKASEASTAAQTATAKAEEAQADADAAALDASQALSAASTATSKASEAAQSASDAVTAKTAAQTAQTAAEGSATAAQTAAQTATQKAAEAAESARTLTIDTTLTQSGQAADSKVVGDALSALQTGAENIDFTDATIYGVVIGASSNKWNDSAGNESYFISVPVSAKSFRITAQDNSVAVFAFLKTDAHARNTVPDYATGSSRITVNTGETLAYPVPEDCRFVAVMKGTSSSEHTPLSAEFVSITGEFESRRELEEQLNEYNNLWMFGYINYGYSVHPQYGSLLLNSEYDTTDYIPVSGLKVIYGYGARYHFYDSEKAIIGTTGVLNNNPALYDGTDMHYVNVPSNAVYFRIAQMKTSPKFLYASTEYENYLKYLVENSGADGRRKLYCLGDSITRGMYAESGASSSSGPTAQGYPYWIGEMNHYDVVNLGNSGSGWANVGSAETESDPSTARNAKNVVDYYDFADADIITMAWGVNDWKGASQSVVLGDMNSVSGDGTVIGNMKYCIETLVTKKPTAQLIVLLPLNTNRQWTGMRTMTLVENWAFGYPYRNNQTLADYRSAIRTCAEYYNVKVIDLEEVCPINRLNIRNVCGDGLHPTKAFHKQMGLALAPLIH